MLFRSEHTVDGQAHNAEVHLVHQKKGSKGFDDLLVLGVMFVVGPKCSPFWDALEFEKWPQKKDENNTVSNVDLNTLSHTIAKGGPLFAYKGSLTTPPCTENVEWRVFQTTEPICQKQVDKLVSAVGKSGNARKTNKLGARVVNTAKASLGSKGKDTKSEPEKPKDDAKKSKSKKASGDLKPTAA